MTIYKVHSRDGHDTGESKGFNFFTTYKEAKQYKENIESDEGWAEIEKIEFDCNKSGIISLLVLHASHPDNG